MSDRHVKRKLTKEEVLAKVEKILAIADPSRNPAENEVATALQMAHKFLRSNGLSMADIATKKAGKVEEDGIVQEDFISFKCSYIPKWMNTILESVNVLTDTKTLFRKDLNAETKYGSITICFIGEETDVAVAGKVFQYLRKTVTKMSSAHKTEIKGNGTDWRSFAEGCSDNILIRAKKIGLESVEGFQEFHGIKKCDLSNFEMEDEDEEEFDNECEEDISIPKGPEHVQQQKYALVLAKKFTQIDDFIDKKKIKSEYRNYTNRKNVDSHDEGYKKAKKISLVTDQLLDTQ